MREAGQLGHYQLVELLGQGGMGAVFRARHTELGVERAVKVLTGDPSPRRVERFLRETQVLARIQHPNVVRIHEAGHDANSGSLYYAMDLVEGEPLHDVLARGRMSWDAAVDVAIDICEGVEALHELGVVHRDLKPANIVLGADGPIVLDLGLAQDIEQSEVNRLTQTGALVGTPLYMAPEQQDASSVTPAADVYALGLIVHELVSGYVLGDSGVLPGLQAPPSPSSLDGSLPRAIDAVVARALERDPSARFSRAGELGAALRAVRDRPGLSRRLRRVLLAGVALLGTGALVVLAVRFAPTAPVERVSPSAAPTAVASDLDPGPGRAALREIKREPDAQRRFEALGEWLRRYAKHPDCKRAEALRRRARRAFPLQVVYRVEKSRLGHRGFALFVGERELVGVWSKGPRQRNLVRWTLDPFARGGARDPGQGQSARASLSLVPGSRQVSLVQRGGVHLIDVDRIAANTRKPIVAPPGFMSAVAWIGAKRVAIAIGEPATVSIMQRDARGRYTLHSTLGPHKGQVNAMAASSDQRYLAVCSNVEQTVKRMKHSAFYLWDIEARKTVWVQPMLSRVRCVRFLPGTHQFVGGTNQGRLILFAPGTRGALAEFSGPGAYVRLDGARSAHQGRVIDLALSPDGARLHTVGSSKNGKRGEWRVWSVAERRQLGPTRAHPEPLNGISVSPDGSRLVLSTPRGFEVWDASVE